LRSLTAAAVAVTAAVALAGCGGSSQAGTTRPASDPLALSSLQVVPALSLSAGGGSTPSTLARTLPIGWAVSFDVRLDPRSALELRLGRRSAPLTLTRSVAGVPVLRDGAGSYTLTDRAGWLEAGSRHIEATNTRLLIDGRSLPLARRRGSTLSLRVIRGSAQISALIISASAARATLLFHRLAELHARIPPRQFPEGASRSDVLHYSAGWMDGFWAGALWQAAAIEPAGGMFASWALAATVDHFGQERADTHDVGFMYVQSSLAAWRALCRGVPGPTALCSRLKRSVLAAAGELLKLAARNPGAGTIPTNSVGPTADTILDSIMNIAVLSWASRITHHHSYAALASHQAHVIAALLVRSDGSTSQSVHFDRASGRVLFVHTHQGLSDSSTWSRGESWALFGFAQTAADLRDPALMSVALNVASYVSGHVPAGAVPRWDYDAAPGAPLDVSAGVIAAAGLMHLASACGQLSGSCDNAARWSTLAQTMLGAAVDKISARPPLGLLGDQALNEHGRGCWCNGGELTLGLSYALEALKLQQHRAS
jgi:unsaturated chondroitin disaccharide hydrolase